METYREFTISPDYIGFAWVHPQYDGAEDAGDNRHGNEATVEACKAAIDEWWEERTFDALKGLLGLVEIIAGRDDLPSEIRVALETNHRTIEAIEVIEAVSPASLADTFARNWALRMKIGPAEGFRHEGLTAEAVAGAVNLLEAVREMEGAAP